MPDKLFFHRMFDVLARIIGITQKRNDLIASNIRNLDTPNYRSKDIDFKTAMARALASDYHTQMKKTHPKHIDIGAGNELGADLIEEKGEWNGIHYVEIDQAMVKLKKNSLLYRAATETLLRKIAMIREVIREGGR